MNTYNVTARLNADSDEELHQRLDGWGLRVDEGEGVVSIMSLPDPVEVPPDLQPTPPGSPQTGPGHVRG